MMQKDSHAEIILRKNPEKVLEKISIFHLYSSDLQFWKQFSLEVISTLKQSCLHLKYELDKSQQNFCGLAMIVFHALRVKIEEWEEIDPSLDMAYPMNYLDAFYLSSYLNAGGEAYPDFKKEADKYLDQILLAISNEFEEIVELVMEYSTNLTLYLSHL